MTSVDAVRRRLARAFAEAGIETAALDARLLLLEALGLTHEALLAEPGRPVSEEEIRQIEALMRRRLAREPVARILGRREFFGRELAIDASTLDPRPDTETLVRHALRFARVRGNGLRILDLGTGSGAVLIALLGELPAAEGVGTDRSEEALRVAAANAARHGVASRARFVRADWCQGLAGRFDLVVSNPPYIPTGEIAALEPEVRHFDPPAALDGGADGLDAYRAISAGAAALLEPGGLCAVEIGAGQQAQAEQAFIVRGWARAADDLRSSPDLAGLTRVLGFNRPAP